MEFFKKKHSAIERLTPQMSAYASDFADSGKINWLPYLMYFHPFNYSSSVVNTDSYGFRYNDVKGKKLSATDFGKAKKIRLLAGSSTVFGIGASSDECTLSSRMTQNDSRTEPWLNFGGRSFNSTQELMLFILHKKLLPDIEEIVIFSGFNNLGLAHLPLTFKDNYGAFFNCTDFYESMNINTDNEETRLIHSQIDTAIDLTLSHLEVWKALADKCNTKVTFVLQPLANWVRKTGSTEEELLFAELEKKGKFSEFYGEILEPNSFEKYVNSLKKGVEEIGVNFINFSPILADAISSEQWLFVDRIHFTDEGYDFISKLLLKELRSLA